MRKGLLIAVFVLFVGFLTTQVEAAKKILPQAKMKGGALTVQRATPGIVVSPRLRKDKKALIVNFGNLQNANSVSYTLVYQTNGIEEAAGGRVGETGGSVTRELFFGTCSGNVCRYHTNIANMRLEVVIDLKSGKKSIKRYRIRV